MLQATKTVGCFDKSILVSQDENCYQEGIYIRDSCREITNTTPLEIILARAIAVLNTKKVGVKEAPRHRSIITYANSWLQQLIPPHPSPLLRFLFRNFSLHP